VKGTVKQREDGRGWRSAGRGSAVTVAVASILAAPARLQRSASDQKSRGRAGAHSVEREEGEVGEKSGQ
jgi:hypothetical protein